VNGIVRAITGSMAANHAQAVSANDGEWRSLAESNRSLHRERVAS
jgi:hypothetical protein